MRPWIQTDKTTILKLFSNYSQKVSNNPEIILKRFSKKSKIIYWKRTRHETYDSVWQNVFLLCSLLSFLPLSTFCFFHSLDNFFLGLDMWLDHMQWRAVLCCVLILMCEYILFFNRFFVFASLCSWFFLCEVYDCVCVFVFMFMILIFLVWGLCLC